MTVRFVLKQGHYICVLDRKEYIDDIFFLHQ